MIILVISLSAMMLLLLLLLFLTRRRAANIERLLDHETIQMERLQRTFEQFAPPDVVEKLSDVSQSFQPTRRSVTVLFADLVGFTPMSEKLDPAVTVEIINGYFQRMTQVISTHQGRVTELIGDGLLALFGAMENNPWQVRDAVLAALEMRGVLEAYNEHLRAKSLPLLKFGVGIHHGEVIAGIMGNANLSKFAVVGDTVNLAARVEGLTRLHGVDILVTEEVRSHLDPQFQLEAMPPVEVKGKSQPVVTFHVKSLVS